MDSRAPHFLVIGAPKSGTTSLFQYLGQHPEIFMPLKKELHYFGSDLKFKRKKPTLNWYQEHFKGSESFFAVGEASVWYFMSRMAAREIHDYNPDMKLILMLRNPYEATPSLHGQWLWGLNEDIDSFDEALRAESDRVAGDRIPVSATFPQGLHYRQVFRYAEQLERYMNYFSSDQLHIILFEEFKSRTEEVVTGVFEFLGVDSEFEPEIEVVNARKKARSSSVARLLHNPPAGLSKLYRSIAPLHLRRHLRGAITKANSRSIDKEALSDYARDELQAAYAEQINRLESMLNRSLAPWHESVTKGIKS